MSADQDGDSQMISSPSSSDLDNNAQTTTPSDSQHNTRSAMPTSASGSAIANANGKRPINTISNGADDADEILAVRAGANVVNGANAGAGKAKPDFPTKTHERSGYQWNRAEDEPGYAWLNKKAMDEYHRAADGLVHKDSMILGRYGDPFEVADKEKAMLNSLKQQ